MFRVAPDQLRTDELRARLEPPGEVERLNAHDDVQRVVGLLLEHRDPVATPRQRAKPHLPRVFVDLAAWPHREPRVCFVAAKAAPALGHKLAGLQGSTAQLKVACPLPMQRPRVVVTRRQRQGRAQHPFQDQRRRSRIAQPYGPRDHVELREHREPLLKHQPRQRVAKDQLQASTPVLVRVRNAVLNEVEPHPPCPILASHHQTRLNKRRVPMHRIRLRQPIDKGPLSRRATHSPGQHRRH